MSSFKELLLLLLIVQISRGYKEKGPRFQPTVGEVWPKPNSRINYGDYFEVSENLNFLVNPGSCAIVQQAVIRYKDMIIEKSKKSYVKSEDRATSQIVQNFQITFTDSCTVNMIPNEEMDESYTLKSNSLEAKSVWGVLRGLETLSQIIVRTKLNKLIIPNTLITDAPRFPYRGIMIDTSRHFIEVDKIIELLDGMSFNKFNVLHWHMTDDQSFPFDSLVYPNLALKGAYFPDMIYSVQNVIAIVEYARLRGIRVIPEFDTPGHMGSWAASHPEIMTKCGGINNGIYGLINPSVPESWEFLYNLYEEIFGIFPDKYVHLGADEVDTDCWETNQGVQDWLVANNMDNVDLRYHYLERLAANTSSSFNRLPILWQEAFIENPGLTLPSKAIAQIWFDYKAVMAKITGDGYRTIMSDGWYLYVLDSGGDWEKFYTVEPTNWTGTASKKELVFGGEGCLWTEFLNSNNIIPTTFPRASAIAERLWSTKETTDINDATFRLEEHNCRMMLRGVHCRPANDFGFC